MDSLLENIKVNCIDPSSKYLNKNFMYTFIYGQSPQRHYWPHNKNVMIALLSMINNFEHVREGLYSRGIPELVNGCTL